MTRIEVSEWEELAAAEEHLVVVSTVRADASVQSSLVNAGVIEHPYRGGHVVGFVTFGAIKLANLRERPSLSVVARSGWKWAAVEGHAELIGPNDGENRSAEELRLLLRKIFQAAGGSHDDWDAYDQTMIEQGRTAVLVEPLRIYSN